MHRIAVVGAGLAGLSAARQLQQQGSAVEVFDKARRPGGRLAVRRSESGPYHMGAPLLSVPRGGIPAATRQFLSQFPQSLLPVAGANVGGGSESGFTVAPHLSAFAQDLAELLNLRCQHTLSRLFRSSEGWHLLFAESETVFGPYDDVLLTMPTAQALALLADMPEQAAMSLKLVTSHHHPCWTVLWEPEQAPADRGFIEPLHQHPLLAMIVREDVRDAATGAPRYVLHAQPSWSLAHLEDTPEQVAEALIQAAAQWLSCEPAARHQHAHRWRFATVAEAIGSPYVAGEMGLWYAGDACLGNTAMDAIRSGLSAAAAIKSPQARAFYQDRAEKRSA